MKKTVLLFAMSLSILLCGQIDWIPTYKEGERLAKEAHKPMLLFIYKPGCGACEFMEEMSFTDKPIYTYINKEFIPIKLNINHNDAPQNLQAVVTPTFHFVDENGKKIRETLIGGKTGNTYLNILKEAVQNYNTPDGYSYE